MLKLAPDELVKLAPRLKSYLPGPDPTWPRVVDAAAFREKAAIAIVSTKDPAHFRTSAGGYFHGMVTKAGQLNLDRTLWGMRRANQPRPTGKPGGDAGRGGDMRSGTRLGH